MLRYLVIALAIPVYALMGHPVDDDSDDSYIVPNSTVQCVNDLVEWCDGMKYPDEGAGVAVVSVNIRDGKSSFQARCISNSYGVNCTRNGSPWFNCTKNNELIYKGNRLRNNSEDGADEGICRTADVAFNILLVQNLSYTNETLGLETGWKSFFEKISELQEHIRALQEQISRFFGNVFGGGGDLDSDEFPWDDESSKAEYDNDASQEDQLEKE